MSCTRDVKKSRSKNKKKYLLNQEVLDLSISEISVGSHGTIWDLRPWLYNGGSDQPRNRVAGYIKQDLLGEPLYERLALIQKLHERFKTLLALGRNQNYVKGLLNITAKFIAWSDKYVTEPLRVDTAEQAFLQWTEYLWHRVHIKKEMNKNVAYDQAAKLAGVLVASLELAFYRSGNTCNPLMAKTRLKRSTGGSPKVDRVNLTKVASFGHFLVLLCKAFTTEAIRGPLPFVLRLPNNLERHWPSAMSLGYEGVLKKSLAQTLRSRSPLHPHEDVACHQSRAAMVNLRVHAELLIFIAQTGMNAQQALRLKRTKIRWRSDDGDVLAFRVYKDRRKGEALFRAFKEYRQWFNAYLTWRDEISPDDERLFPFLSGRIIPPEDQRRRSPTFKKLCEQADVPYFSFRDIRNIKQNWLLRLTGSPELTASLGAHTKQTLLRVYEKPHHQSASARISHYHHKFDSSAAAGPGLCADLDHTPTFESYVPPAAPEPDCISPDGCLFCVHHRDILDFDYTWKLTSHAHLKGIERDGYERPMKDATEPHPADVVIDRIEAKLLALAKHSKNCAAWVVESKNRVWEGNYHPAWAGFIELWDLVK